MKPIERGGLGSCAVTVARLAAAREMGDVRRMVEEV